MKEHLSVREINSRGDFVRQAEVASINVEARTVELAFSSETPVRQWYGMEILSHAPGAADLSRLNDGGANLMDHNWSDQVGVIESAQIDGDRRGRAVVRFGNSARANEIFQDVQDRIRRHVSVGYRVLDIVMTEQSEDGPDVYTVTRWLPYEISWVAVPADTTVGVGRSLAPENPHVEPTRAAQENQPVPGSGRGENHLTGQRNMDPVQDPQQTIDASAVRREGSEAERARAREIIEMGDQYGAADLAREFVKDGKSAGEFQRALLAHIEQRQARPLSEQTRDASIGLTDKEIGGYRFMNVIRALANPTDRKAQEGAAFEIEASRAAADKLGKEAEGILVPPEVLSRSLNMGSNGQTGAGSTGAASVATDLMASAFIDMLKNATTIMRLGRPLGGLVGNIDIPKKTARSQGYWLGEEDNAREQEMDLGQIALSPKTVAAYSDISRKLMQQSSLDVEALVRADLAEALGLAIDWAGYYGSGSDHQPRGIANYTGINAIPFAGTFPTYEEVVAMETAIASKNAAVANMAYIVDAATKGKAKTTQKFPSTPTGATLWEQGDTMNGYRTEVTNQLADGDVFMGNFADLIIALWGGLDLTVDKMSLSKSGGTRIVVFQDVDFALRRVESFARGRGKPAA
ncbi:phage major capsid protein [Burkholderia stagnalis]|nr:phage major capsid protein [Burkholderia stagnalis]RQQ55736.1 phage major capsid protein [Burkholderia stagnalis]RQY19190.1 phage major capsid protein [Burkholderia stagnalis]RQY64520.1 phage major capsid protein [Burkholderia stagnalis]RQY70705.1 phage major capsid protein [Burkholderia stagnalis]